jgi:hypothetical protein
VLFIIIVNFNTSGARVFGPFVHLPVSQQQQALDLIYFFPSISPLMEKALLACCLHESVPAETVSRAIQIFEHHYTRKNDISPEHYVAFLVSLQVGMGQKLESSRNAGTKRKRSEEEENEVMEVDENGKEGDNANKEAEKGKAKKEEIIPSKIREVSETVCFNFGMLSGTVGTDKVMGTVLQILTSTLLLISFIFFFFFFFFLEFLYHRLIISYRRKIHLKPHYIASCN